MAIELVVRTAACTAALILAVVLARAPNASRASRLFGAALCLGVASYLACSGSDSLAVLSDWVTPTLLLASWVPFFFWGWAASIVDDDFRLPPAAIAGAVALLAVSLLGMATSSPRSEAIEVAVHSVVGIGFVIAALVNVLRGWRQDLVEARRRLRALIVVLCGGYSIGIMAVELVLAGRPPSAELLLLNAVLLATLLLGLACAVLDVSASVQSAFGWAPPTSQSVEPARVGMRDREQELIERLQQLMTQAGAYRDATLAVASLAARLGVAEKKLREVINRRLGFKNFSSYVNAFRLEEVRQRLLDPRHDAIPILTMALEAGFGSIVAFNRAFKGKYGVPPTAYRAHRDSARGTDKTLPEDV